MPLRSYISADQAEEAMRAGDRNGLRELLNLAPGANTADNPLLIRCLEEANSTVDVYVQGVVSTPMREIPPMLRRIALNLLVANIAAARPGIDSPDIQDRARASMAELRDIRDKKTALEFPQENRTERLLQPQLVTVGNSSSSTRQTEFRRTLGAM